MILKVGLPSDRKTICFCTPERPDDRSFAVFRASSQLVPPFGHALTAVPIAPGEVVNCEVVRALSLNVTTAICTCCSAGRAAFAAVRSLLAKAVAAFFAFVSRLLFFHTAGLVKHQHNIGRHRGRNRGRRTIAGRSQMQRILITVSTFDFGNAFTIRRLQGGSVTGRILVVFRNGGRVVT